MFGVFFIFYISEYGNIYYEVHGPEGAPVLVFTHGIIMDHTTYDDQLSFFSAHYRVVLWDMPGHGRSVIKDDEFDFSMTARCLIGILDEINADSVVLIGLSLGGLISQYVAYHYPERVTAVAVIGSNPLHSDRTLLSKTFNKVAWGMVLAISRFMPEDMLALVNSKGKAIKKPTKEYLLQLAHQAGKKKMIGFTRATMTGIMEGIDKPINQPLLISHGEKEVTFNIKQAIKWHKQISHSRYSVISDAGHIANQDNPQGFNKSLQLFLSAIRNRRIVVE